MNEAASTGVSQLRIVVEVDDVAAATAFFTEGLGLKERAAFQGEGGALVSILEAGVATLELVNAAQREMIDRVEVGRPASPRFRLAFEVDDSVAATVAAAASGATLVAPPTETPWRSLNSRLDTPFDLQLTLFQELGPQA